MALSISGMIIIVNTIKTNHQFNIIINAYIKIIDLEYYIIITEELWLND